MSITKASLSHIRAASSTYISFFWGHQQGGTQILQATYPVLTKFCVHKRAQHLNLWWYEVFDHPLFDHPSYAAFGFGHRGVTPSASVVKAYEELYKPNAFNAKALAALFNPSHPFQSPSKKKIEQVLMDQRNCAAFALLPLPAFPFLCGGRQLGAYSRSTPACKADSNRARDPAQARAFLIARPHREKLSSLWCGHFEAQVARYATTPGSIWQLCASAHGWFALAHREVAVPWWNLRADVLVSSSSEYPLTACKCCLRKCLRSVYFGKKMWCSVADFSAATECVVFYLGLV